jgi:hypothetical protein
MGAVIASEAKVDTTRVANAPRNDRFGSVEANYFVLP